MNRHKYVFWNVIHKNSNIALTEDLSTYAQGETFWKAMFNLCQALKEWVPSSSPEESEINSRLRMYYETGINKVEILVEKADNRVAVKCANSRSFFETADEKKALLKYIEGRAKTSVVNTGGEADI